MSQAWLRQQQGYIQGNYAIQRSERNRLKLALGGTLNLASREPKADDFLGPTVVYGAASALARASFPLPLGPDLLRPLGQPAVTRQVARDCPYHANSVRRLAAKIALLAAELHRQQVF